MSIPSLIDDFLRIGLPVLVGIAAIVIAVRNLDRGWSAKLLATAGVLLVASWLILVFLISPVGVESSHSQKWVSWNSGTSFWGYAALWYFQPLAVLTLFLGVIVSFSDQKPNKSFKFTHKGRDS